MSLTKNYDKDGPGSTDTRTRTPSTSWGCPSRWRCQIAIRSGVITRFTSLLVAAFQAMIFWVNTATTSDTYVNPAHVRT